ncbi:MAG: MFS transporter [Chloroflexi bacterium]|nr:MFS transporter [Chloroflexota bacterium]
MAFSISHALNYLKAGLSRILLLHPQNQEERNMRLLYLNTAMVGVASGGIVAFLPVFLARLGANSAMVSWLTSGPALVAVIFLIPGAVIAERQENQVKVRVTWISLVLLGYLLCAVAPFFVPVGYLPIVLIILWSFKVLAEAVTIPAWTAVMARAVSPQRRAQLNGTRWALMSLVMAVSSAFFGWLLDHVAFPFNYQLVFFISFAVAVIDPIFFARIKIAPIQVIKPQRGAPWRERVRNYFRPVFSHKPFVVYLLATFLYRVALNMPVPLFTLLWVNELRAPDTLIGLRGTVGYGALVVGYMLWGRIANRIGHRKVLFISALGLAAYVIISSFLPSAIWILPVALLWGMTASGIDVGLFDLMLGACQAERQPLFAAFWSIEANLAVFIGPLIGAALSDTLGLRSAILIGGLLQAVTTLPFLRLPRD